MIGSIRLGDDVATMNDDGSWSVPTDPELEAGLNAAYTHPWYADAVSPVPHQNFGAVLRDFRGTVVVMPQDPPAAPPGRQIVN
jgi:hypothetical protein